MMKNLQCKPEQFTHLHAHSQWSIKDGSIPIRTLVDKQVENGSKAIAVTDHGMLTGGWFLYDYIHNVKKLKDVRHVIGIEAYLSETRDELQAWLPTSEETVPDKDERAAKRKLLAQKYHQILLCKNQTGYANAIKIHNDAWLKGFYYSPTTTKEFIFAHAEGLIATTTCLASLWNRKIMAGDIQGAEREIMLWKGVFGDDFYVELQPTNSKTQALVNKELIKLARKTKTRMIITNDVHYIEAGDHELHFTLLNLSKLKKGLEEGGTEEKLWEFDVNDLYIKSLDDMYDSWKTHHRSAEFTESLFEETVNTIGDIVSQIEHYSLESKPLLPSVDEVDPFERLKLDTIAGFKEKLDKGVIPKSRLEEYQDRIAYELEVIQALGAENYMNICALIARWCKTQKIQIGPGRGSAAGSLVLYLLGVTQVDSIQHGLYFERFLSPGRRTVLQM